MRTLKMECSDKPLVWHESDNGNKSDNYLLWECKFVLIKLMQKNYMIENTEITADVLCFPTSANVMYLLGLLASARVQPKVS